ncbi:Aste57867_8187 [Aphanomyces stellatus]|uniref:Aste57867_8187 protein n=1 Tax=Aphanomyces stellatus TaxID=120398 RepID=A0A485KJM7_9STRA|nr:hypothetical protein As57867_008156 [Aphanomyces stellatus]VFT85075.1 Aste57867_8187 [Aphanomyces stellatus]
MPIEIVGCGFGRTGTTSLKLALQQLGYPTYHMVDLKLNEDEDFVKWKRIADKNGATTDWGDLFTPANGRPPYRATVDWPSTTYYESILAQYPHAKVILTVRDSPEQWLASVEATIAAPGRTQSAAMEALKRQIIWDHPAMFGGKFPDNGIAVYNAWIEHVKSHVPSERLLILNVKDGWRPLCEFLGLPVVQGPFPHANDRESFADRLRHAQGYVLPPATPGP